MEFQKLQFVKQSFETNPIAQKIARRKELEILGWEPDEIDEVMQIEEQPAPVANPQLEDGEQPTTPESAVPLEEGALSPQTV